MLAGLIGLAMVPAGDMPAVDLRVEEEVVMIPYGGRNPMSGEDNSGIATIRLERVKGGMATNAVEYSPAPTCGVPWVHTNSPAGRVDRRVIVTATAEIHPDTKRVIITDDWLAEWWRIMHEFQGMGFTVEPRGER